MIRVIYKELGITGIVTACRVEKNASAAGSEAEITAVCSPGDRYLPAINPACGDAVRIEGENGELFAGAIERVAFSADRLTVTMVCFDEASKLSKNELYAAFSGTPADVAARVCGAVGLELGSAWRKAGGVFVPASCALSAHRIIRQAYADECVIECEGGKINILEPGARKAQADVTKLLGVWARHSAEGMVNRAEVIGYKGRTDARAQNEGDIAAYGARARVFSLTGARSTAAAQAASRLTGLKREAGITLFGQAEVKCGDLIAVDAPEFGLSGEWTASMVTHEFSRGFCTTDLGLVKM